ncbi:MAG: metallophosphoesterase, partial [Planctomycetaceae bacterium]
MVWKRRQFIGLIPVSALSIHAAAGGIPTAGAAQAPPQGAGAEPATLLTSPPVVQHPAADSFTVHFAVSTLATGWVEWGRSADRLDQVAIAADHGLVRADDRALSVRVWLDEPPDADQPIFYRVVAQPLSYRNAYQLSRGEAQASPVMRLRLPSATADEITIAIINDTHENKETLATLHDRLDTLDPDLLVWNGDTTNDFNAQVDPMQIVLNPAGNASRGWAAERPLLFVPGNHDVRGARARELTTGLSGWPGQADLPYNFALRLGPVALIGLDTGEDKPDAHPVFAGTAAYEPYRQQQATWLKSAVERPEVAAAPIKIAVCHIPLRGRPGDNDGTTLDGYASYSGMGARLWLPILRQAGFHAVISGHTHRHRIDDATDSEPIVQVVGGGPQPDRATLTLIRAAGNAAELQVEDLAGNRLSDRRWPAN